MKPAYLITVGSWQVDSRRFAAGSLPVDILVELRLNQVNTARLSFYLAGNGSVQAGDPAIVELGVGDERQVVFTGQVQAVKRELRGLTIHCQSRLSALVNSHMNKLYEKQKAGEIVSDLAGLVEVETGQVENGFQFPVYVLADAETLFDHVLALARRNGFDCYADAEDKLVFAPFAGQTVHRLQYGVNILDGRAETAPEVVSGVEVYGESPSSLGQGSEAYSWLTKKEVKGSAGTAAGTTLRLADPALKDLDTAGLVAQALFQQLSRRKSGQVRVPGLPAVQLGDAIQLQDMPDGGLDGLYQVTAVCHQLNKRSGFVTTIHYQETA